MKTIKVPAPVTLTNPNGSVTTDPNGNPLTITFKDFVSNTLLVDQKYGASMADILSAVEVKQKLSSNPEELVLDDSDYEKLLAVAKNPTNGYNPVVVMQIVGFLRAISDAS